MLHLQIMKPKTWRDIYETLKQDQNILVKEHCLLANSSKTSLTRKRLLTNARSLTKLHKRVRSHVRFKQYKDLSLNNIFPDDILYHIAKFDPARANLGPNIDLKF